MGAKSLVALDVDHIKRYVFATDKLKEIRGGSSRLDGFNRVEMKRLAQALDKDAFTIFAHGGSGLFLIDSAQAEMFVARVKRLCRERTGGGASVTCVIQPMPPDAPETVEKILTYPLQETLTLLRSRLRAEKGYPPEVLALPSHPFLCPCSSCGMMYAAPAEEEEKQMQDAAAAGKEEEVATSEVAALEKEGKDTVEEVALEEEEDEEVAAKEATLEEEDERYCRSCQLKREEDDGVKRYVSSLVWSSRMRDAGALTTSKLWWCLLSILRKQKYKFARRVDRPRDFQVFQGRALHRKAKSYLGLIYADANGMGQHIESISTLGELKEFARKIDGALYQAVGEAIARHLPIDKFELVNPDGKAAFPFDILLLGGDDLVMVVPAAVALQVARTIAELFYTYANVGEKTGNGAPYEKDAAGSGASGTNKKLYSLSLGVVLAPLKYPFNLLLELAEECLKETKKAGARVAEAEQSAYGKTRVSFMTVTGSISQGYKRLYESLREKKMGDPGGKPLPDPIFYATLRPYTLEHLGFLLEMIHDGNRLGLGRTKLHQLREAVLQKNLTTAVSDSRAILVSWEREQRKFVVDQLYALASDYQKSRYDPAQPDSLFPQVVFPWFLDGLEEQRKRYRTVLLDLVELYDFIAREEDDRRGAEQD